MMGKNELVALRAFVGHAAACGFLALSREERTKNRCAELGLLIV